MALEVSELLIYLPQLSLSREYLSKGQLVSSGTRGEAI